MQQAGLTWTLNQLKAFHYLEYSGTVVISALNGIVRRKICHTVFVHVRTTVFKNRYHKTQILIIL